MGVLFLGELPSLTCRPHHWRCTRTKHIRTAYSPQHWYTCRMDESGAQPQQSGKVSDMTRYLLKEVRQGQLLQVYQTHSIQKSLTNQPV